MLLKHWESLLTDLGATQIDATAAIDQVEKEVMNHSASVWTTFAQELHKLGHANTAARNIDEEIRNFFQDWSRDQSPMPITIAEVTRWTARTKKAWLAKRRTQLTKRRNLKPTAASDGYRQTGIARFKTHQRPNMPPKQSGPPRYHRTILSAQHRATQARPPPRQTILRDFGYAEPSLVPLANLTATSKPHGHPSTPSPARRQATVGTASTTPTATPDSHTPRGTTCSLISRRWKHNLIDPATKAKRPKPRPASQPRTPQTHGPPPTPHDIQRIHTMPTLEHRSHKQHDTG